MTSFRNKLMALAFCFTIISSPISYASDLVKYNDINLDEVLDDNGIYYDKKEVENRTKEYINNPNEDVVPDFKPIEETVTEETTVKDNGEVEVTETTETTYEDQKKEPIYSKTPVYKKVVDISEHQNPSLINYDKFAKSIDGAILRTSIMDADTLNIRTDYHLEEHYRQLNSRGVPLGFYHYSRAINSREAIREAEYVSRVLKNKNVSYPVYIDIEDDKRQAKASKADISEAAEAFILAMRRNGYVSGIYSYPWFANNYLTKDLRNKYEFWIADYASKNFTKYNGSDFDSWQFTDKGYYNGYKYNVDTSVVYKDYPMIIKGRSKKSMDELVSEIIAGRWGTGAERKKRLIYAGYDYNIVQKAVNDRLKITRA